MRNVAISLVLSFALSACGGDEAAPKSSNGGEGGAGGATGGAGGATAGAGGGTGAVTRGAASFHIVSGPGCSLPDQFQDFPVLASGHPVTDTQKIQSVESGGTTADGQPVSLLCNWLGFQAPYTFDSVLKIGPAGNERWFNIGASIQPGQEVQGGIVLIAPELPQQYGSDPTDPCVYTVISVDEATRSVWGRLHCGIFAPNDGSDSCTLGDSYFFFENCVVPTAP